MHKGCECFVYIRRTLIPRHATKWMETMTLSRQGCHSNQAGWSRRGSLSANVLEDALRSVPPMRQRLLDNPSVGKRLGLYRYRGGRKCTATANSTDHTSKYHQSSHFTGLSRFLNSGRNKPRSYAILDRLRTVKKLVHHNAWVLEFHSPKAG